MKLFRSRSICIAACLLPSASAFVSVPLNRGVMTMPPRAQPLFESSSSSDTEARHEVRSSGPIPGLSPEEQERLEEQAQSYMQFQQEAPKLDWATEVRTLVQYNHGYAVMSTISKAEDGYPGGSVVGFVPDADGNPLFLFSGMSTHTQDILANPKCSVTVAAKEFKGAADGRVNLMGQAHKLSQDEIPMVRELYLQKHLNSKVWIDFGDFNWFRMVPEKIRFVGGFARAGSISAEEYTQAKPDVIAQFGGPVADHMNADHSGSTLAMVKTLLPGLEDMTLKAAEIVSVDSLGMYVKVTREPGMTFQPEQFKTRLPFPKQAGDRKDVKTLIVEMTKKAAAAE